eukprot:TRINITY_DN13585_c0_g1_i1.p2 TRINITY_DN13585_c0_g1~~TRINITY_DN13585_c0_g1_i1.p2  ORF type:complete len:123 (+),score=41.94 TRINITY_DN13585_c0_g1_i1:53-421(+)
MPRTLALCLLLVLVLAACFGTAEAKKSKKAAGSRTERCGTDTDCVTIHVKDSSSQLIIDDLDFSDTKDTAAKIEKRLPEWFGPKRPLVFTRKNGEELERDVPLKDYGLKLGETVFIESGEEL